jgi:hypothetical protein
VLTAIAIIPSTPVVVPQLVGDAATELTELRKAVLAAASALPERWLAIGAGRADEAVGDDALGTFAGYGIDLPVGLSPDAARARELPLSALITAWVRTEVRPSARAEVRIMAAGDPVRRGVELRSMIDGVDAPIGVLVVADGANTLTPKAPGGYDPASVAVQASLDDALAGGDVAALAQLPASVTGRAAWQALSGLAGAKLRSVKELYRGAPFGVGYFVGVWLP